MNDAAENIPTLTDIVHSGDESMLNHFDAHQFSDAEDNSDEDIQADKYIKDSEGDMQNLMEVSDIFEGADTFDNDISEPEEIPSIKLDNEQQDYIEEEDFSDAMQLMSEDNSDNSSEKLMTEANQFDRDILKEKINQAVKEILPGIEEQLRKQLYKQLNL